MSSIRSKNTKPELAVRSVVFGMGYRYRIHRSDLPGSPDLVFPGRKKIIFVHGCFWHGHKRCTAAHIPDANKEFWRNKIERNCRRDAEAVSRLKALGWRVRVFWECEIGGKRFTERVRSFLDAD